VGLVSKLSCRGVAARNSDLLRFVLSLQINRNVVSCRIANVSNSLPRLIHMQLCTSYCVLFYQTILAKNATTRQCKYASKYAKVVFYSFLVRFSCPSDSFCLRIYYRPILCLFSLFFLFGILWLQFICSAIFASIIAMIDKRVRCNFK